MKVIDTDNILPNCVQHAGEMKKIEEQWRKKMRLIDANELWKAITTQIEEYCDLADLIEIIEAQATVDAKPVRHGKWIKDGVTYSLYKCTACNDLCTVAGWANCIPEEQMYKAFKYCPNCGAKMDDGKNETVE